MALATLPITIIGATDAPLAAQAQVSSQQDLDRASDAEAVDKSGDSVPAQSSLSRQSTYTVSGGESLTSIAAKFKTTSRELLRINQLSEDSLLLPGQVITLVENAVHPSVIEKTIGPSHHVVKSGETLSQIAHRYSLKLNSLLALNSLQERSLIYPGQRLTVREVTPQKTASTVVNSGEHIVSAGETLSQIASRHKVSLPALLNANKLTKTSLIFVGQILDIPTGADQAPKANISGNVIGQPTAICLFHGFHKIKAGETLSKLAGVYGVSVQSLMTANSLTSTSTIYIGQKLVIPNAHGALDCPRLTPLTDEMRISAQAIINVGRELGVGDYGIVIALATAMQESSLRNINFGDRDSIGLFQQRPSAHWGTKAQIMNPDYAIRAFFGGKKSPVSADVRGLLDVSNWRNLPLTEAAQAVQISAHPTAYAKWEPSAWNWLIELDKLEDS
ncbi:MAG: hypothetical protein RL149_246 [Actinomycetota bacterium]